MDARKWHESGTYLLVAGVGFTHIDWKITWKLMKQGKGTHTTLEALEK
jgi:hypothetical protein